MEIVVSALCGEKWIFIEFLRCMMGCEAHLNCFGRKRGIWGHLDGFGSRGKTFRLDKRLIGLN